MTQRVPDEAVTTAAAPPAPELAVVELELAAARPLSEERCSLSTWAAGNVPAAHMRAFSHYVREVRNDWHTRAAWAALYDKFMTRPIGR